MRRLIARPATALFSSPGERDLTVVCVAAYMSNEHGAESTLELEGTESIRMIDLATVDNDGPGMIVGSTSPSGLSVTVRATIEDDAVAVEGLPGYPLPVRVITASISGENMDTHIEALVEDDGYVSTILLVTDVGLFTRYARTWIALRDVNLIDGLNSVEVEDGAVDVYDAADDLGQQVSIDGLPSEDRDRVGAGQLFVAASAPRTFATATEPVTASAELPIVDTPEQLTAAIESAVSDPSIRWYIEKRVRALEMEVELPWE